MTFRPRVLVRSATLDLTTDLFGLKMFAPLLVGPMAQQRRFHPEAELATVRGAEAAQTVVVVSSRLSEPHRSNRRGSPNAAVVSGVSRRRHRCDSESDAASRERGLQGDLHHVW